MGRTEQTLIETGVGFGKNFGPAIFGMPPSGRYMNGDVDWAVGHVHLELNS